MEHSDSYTDDHQLKPLEWDFDSLEPIKKNFIGYGKGISLFLVLKTAGTEGDKQGILG